MSHAPFKGVRICFSPRLQPQRRLNNAITALWHIVGLKPLTRPLTGRVPAVRARALITQLPQPLLSGGNGVQEAVLGEVEALACEIWAVA